MFSAHLEKYRVIGQSWTVLKVGQPVPWSLSRGSKVRYQGLHGEGQKSTSGISKAALSDCYSQNIQSLSRSSSPPSSNEQKHLHRLLRALFNLDHFHNFYLSLLQKKKKNKQQIEERLVSRNLNHLPPMKNLLSCQFTKSPVALEMVEMELIIVNIHPLVKLSINVSILWLDNTIQLISKSSQQSLQLGATL